MVGTIQQFCAGVQISLLAAPFPVHYSTMTLLNSTLLYITVPWLYFTLFYSTIALLHSSLLYISLQWLYFTLLYSTLLFHSSTSLY